MIPRERNFTRRYATTKDYKPSDRATARTVKFLVGGRLQGVGERQRVCLSLCHATQYAINVAAAWPTQSVNETGRMTGESAWTVGGLGVAWRSRFPAGQVARKRARPPFAPDMTERLCVRWHVISGTSPTAIVDCNS